VLHSEVYFLNIRTEPIPRVPNFEKIEVEKFGLGVHRIIAHFGFMEEPSITRIFSLCKAKGLTIELGATSFFLGRAQLSAKQPSSLGRWRSQLFLFLTRNALDPAGFYNIPAEQIIEVGARLEI